MNSGLVLAALLGAAIGAVVACLLLWVITAVEKDRIRKFRLQNVYGDESSGVLTLNFDVPDDITRYDLRIIFRDAAGYYYLTSSPAMRVEKKNGYQTAVVIPPVPGPLNVEIILVAASAVGFLGKFPISANRTYQLGDKLHENMFVVGELSAPVGTVV
jgi:hypothetical protein